MYYFFLAPMLFFASVVSKPNTTFIIKQTKDTIYMYSNLPVHMCNWKDLCPFDPGMRLFHSDYSKVKFEEADEYEREKLHFDHPTLNPFSIEDSIKVKFPNTFNL